MYLSVSEVPVWRYPVGGPEVTDQYIAEHVSVYIYRGFGSGFWQKKTGSGALYLEYREILNSIENKFLDNFRSLFFMFGCQTFDVIDKENHPGSGKIGTGAMALTLTENE